MDKKPKISRRTFLKKTGWTAVGLTAIAAVSYPVIGKAIPVLPTFNEPERNDGFAWIQILPDGRVRFFCPRMEMGQNASTGLSQIVAEELNIGHLQLECLQPATNQTPPFQMSVGSESIRNFFLPVSTAAAHLREELRARAAKLGGMDVAAIKDDKAGFLMPDGTIVKYKTLAAGEAVILSDNYHIDENTAQYALQNTNTHHAIGKPWKHPDLEKIVTGQNLYSRDAKMQGMVYATIFHPPAFNATLKPVDANSIEDLENVQIIPIDKGNNFAGIVRFVALTSSDLPTLQKAKDALKIEWQIPNSTDSGELINILDVDRHRGENDFEHMLSRSGNLETARPKSEIQLEARYDTPFHAHCAMEPRAALADVKEDRVDIWCGSQDAFFVQKRVAALLERPATQVVVYPQRMGGGFGGRIQCKAAEEAALISAEIGAPVRVQWSREQEFQNVYFQPAFSHRIDAGANSQARITHWAHDFVSSPIITGLLPQNIGRAADFIVADEGTARGAIPPYALASHQIRFSDIRTDVPIGPWRGLGAAPNAFAIESMMDELALATRTDPLEFRLKNISEKNGRLASVLRKVIEISGGKFSNTTTEKDTGKGLACAVYKDETPVAIVARVSVDHGARQIRITHIWCAHDCGLVINPDQVESLIEGNIIWGCSMAMKEQITFDQGAVEQDNFHSYEILSQQEAPEIEVALVTSDNPPYGVGESALPPVAPAITNALFAATRTRARKLPIRYEEVFAR